MPLPMLVDRFLGHAREETRRRHVNWFGTGLLQYLPDPVQEDLLANLSSSPDPVIAAMEMDFSGYLRENLLTKLDRASMLWSLETRAPFLDRHVIGFARSLPRSDKVRGWRLKVALSRAAGGVVPKWVIQRRKRGLSVPIARWINEGLRDEIDHLLEPSRIAHQPFMPDLPLPRLLNDHRRGVSNHSRALWPVIVLQLWLRNWEGDPLV